MIARRFIVPLTVAGCVLQAASALAQGAFPAPLPNQSSTPSASPFPPVNGAPAAAIGAPSAFSTGAPPVSGGFAPPQPQQQAGPPDDCMKKFVPLREDAEKRGKAIQAAGQRRAPPDEACKLIGNFSQAEVKMIKFIEANSQKCGIPAQVADQLKTGHKRTEQMQAKVCSVAQQQQQRAPAGPSLSDVLGSSTAIPEATTAKRSGGSTFDTLNGNVLAR
ncbi:hypothetical protein [Rhodopseudomonas palustris]|uniref:hypothetical protein n=1 Tax=Rhodopseudomonas palustris TaxID=1076 RepID=UPI0002F4C602